MKISARWIPKFSLNGLIRAGLGLALVLFFLVDATGWIEFRPLTHLELQAYDARVRLFLPKTRDPRVVIVDIDQQSLNAEGHWPWGRDKLALLIRQLFEKYQVRVVGFDVAFPEADPSSGLPVLEAIAAGDLKDNAGFQAFLQRARASLDYDRLFADEVAKWPVVLGFLLGANEGRSGVLPKPTFGASALANAEFRYFSATGYSANIAMLQASATAAGHLYPALDPDGVTRSVPMFVRVGDGFFEAMSLAVLRIALGNVPVDLEVDTVGTGERPQGWIRAVRVGEEVRIPLDVNMAALVPYRDVGGYRYVPATDVLRGRIGADELKDKIVLVGTSAQGLVDIRATPGREDLPGVEVHASLVSGALDHTIKFRPAEALAISVLTILLLGLPLALLLPRLSALASTLVVAVAFALVLGANLWAWQAKNYVLPLAGALLMLAGLYVVNMVYGFFAESRSKRLITNLFGTYVPKEIVEEMARHPDEYSMSGKSCEMTVLFSDIRDFTSISEGLTPARLKDLINTYLTEMTKIVQEKRGTVDKYIGDAIMAFWGAPVPDAKHAHARARVRPRDAEGAAHARSRLREEGLAGAAHRGGAELRHHERGRHGLGLPPLLHGDGRRGEPRLAPGGPHQGIRRGHPRLREHRPGGAVVRLPPGRQGAREGQAHGGGHLRAGRPAGRGRRRRGRGDRALPRGARALPQAAMGRGRAAAARARRRLAARRSSTSSTSSASRTSAPRRPARTGTASSSSPPSERARCRGGAELFGELPDVRHELPDLLVGQVLVRRHRGAGRAEADDPEQLPVGHALDGLGAGEVARTRVELGRELAVAAAGRAVALGAAELSPDLALEELLRGTQVAVRRQRIGPAVPGLRRLAGEARLRAGARRRRLREGRGRDHGGEEGEAEEGVRAHRDDSLEPVSGSMVEAGAARNADERPLPRRRPGAYCTPGLRRLTSPVERPTIGPRDRTAGRCAGEHSARRPGPRSGGPASAGRMTTVRRRCHVTEIAVEKE